MAKGDINQRISLTGGDEVANTLSNLAAKGDRVGPALRNAFGIGGQAAQNFSAAAQTADRSSRQLGFALTNLSFQANDVATSLASGSSVFQVFAQQTGQIFQAIQQGGGLGPVLRGIGEAITAMITPMRAFIAAGVAFVAGVALIVSRVVDANEATRQFDVTLQAMGKSSRISGAELEQAAERLRTVGLTAAEARKDLFAAQREGIDPIRLEKVVEIGANLNAVFGEGTMEKFISAVGQGGAPLEEFAQKLGILPKVAFDASKGLDEVAKATERSNRAIEDAFRKRNRSIQDEQLQTNRAILDLTRKKGTEEQELVFQQNRRISDINRQTNREINDIMAERFRESRRLIDEFNKQVTDAANKASGDQSLVDAIGNKVTGFALVLKGPVGRALTNLADAWDKLLLSFGRSQVIVKLIEGFTAFVKVVADLLASNSGIPALALVITTALIPALIAVRAAIFAITLASGPWGIAIGLISAAILALVLNWDAVMAKIAEFQTFFSGVLTSVENGITGLGQFFSGLATSITNGVSTVAQFFADKWKAAVTAVENLVNTLVDWFKGGFQQISDALSAVSNFVLSTVNSWLGWFDTLIGKAAAVASAIANAISGDSALNQVNTGGLARARGGPVWGAGTSTSDSIAAWLSNGEFVVNAFQTKRWLPVLQAINRGLKPSFVRGGMVMPRYAMGGLVTQLASPNFFRHTAVDTGASPRSTINLTIGDATFNGLIAPEETAQQIIRVARRQSVRRTGRMPGWYSG